MKIHCNTSVGRNGVNKRSARSLRTAMAATRGYSVVELMVAITIGAIILAAVVKIFSSSRSTYQMDEGLARLQENARFAVEQITRETRQAASMGCARGKVPKNYLNVPVASGGFAFEANQFLGFEATGTGPGNTRSFGSYPANSTGDWASAVAAGTSIPLTSFLDNAMPGSDVLVLRRMSSAPAKLRAPYTDQDTVYLSLTDINRFRKDDVVLIYDCQKSTIFQITAIAGGTDLSHDGTGTPGNACTAWVPGNPACGFGGPKDLLYSDVAEVAQIQTTVYFVGNTGPPRNVPALFQRTFPGGPAEELVEGVENMQVLYGVDTLNSDMVVDNYLTADAVSAGNLWGSVIAARVSLLMSTVNTEGKAADSGLDTSTYFLNGSDAASAVTIDPPDDNRQRRVFEATILLRTRGV